MGGVGPIPPGGGGIPRLTDNGSFITPFDAFSLRVPRRAQAPDPCRVVTLDSFLGVIAVAIPDRTPAV